jgi:bacteriorhodopsin
MKQLTLIIAALVSASASAMASTPSSNYDYAIFGWGFAAVVVISVIIWLLQGGNAKVDTAELAAEAEQFFANMRAQLVGRAKLPTERKQ